MSYFFRANLQGSKQHTITLDKELVKCVHTYHSNKHVIQEDLISILMLKTNIAMCLYHHFYQILVENAIKHAFTNRKQGNDIDVSVIKETATHVRIIVQDNGQGIRENAFVGENIL